MQLYKYRLSIFIFFISIFALKMLVSVLPVDMNTDKYSVKSAVLDLEQEDSQEGDSKDLLKYNDYKCGDFYHSYIYTPLLQQPRIKNCFIDHSKRYVDPYHPSVPTPPPNTPAIQASLI